MADRGLHLSLATGGVVTVLFALSLAMVVGGSMILWGAEGALLALGGYSTVLMPMAWAEYRWGHRDD